MMLRFLLAAGENNRTNVHCPTHVFFRSKGPEHVAFAEEVGYAEVALDTQSRVSARGAQGQAERFYRRREVLAQSFRARNGSGIRRAVRSWLLVCIRAALCRAEAIPDAERRCGDARLCRNA